MSLAAVTAEFSLRLDDVRNTITMLTIEESNFPAGSPPSYSQDYRRLAGLCFVMLYAALEFGVSASTRFVLQTLATSGVNKCDLLNPLYCIVLNGEFDSAATVKSNKKWKARLSLLANQIVAQPISVSDSVFDADLQMTSAGVMRQIFDAFGIGANVTPSPALLGYLDEVRDKRNAISHGRDRVTSVGAGITSGDLNVRCDAISSVTTHFIAVLDGWLAAKDFIRPVSRHLYP